MPRNKVFIRCPKNNPRSGLSGRVTLSGPNNERHGRLDVQTVDRATRLQRHDQRSFSSSSRPEVLPQLPIHHFRILPLHAFIPNWLLGAQTFPRAKALPADMWVGVAQVHLTRLWRCTRPRRLIGARAIKQVPPGESLFPFCGPTSRRFVFLFLSCATIFYCWSRERTKKQPGGDALANAYYSFSSSASGMSTDDEKTDDDTHTVIGRRGSVSAETRNGGAGESNRNPPRVPSPTPPPASSSDGSKRANGRANTSTLSRRTFTRSRSPAPQVLGLNGIMPQPPLPSPTAFLRPRSAGPPTFILPATLSLTLSSRLTSWQYALLIDTKMAAEGAILTLALACAAQKLRSSSSALLPFDDGLPIGMLTSLRGMFVPCQSCTRQSSMPSSLPPSLTWSGITLPAQKSSLCSVLRPTRHQPLLPRHLDCQSHVYLVVVRQSAALRSLRTEDMYG
jgi:hypothetical protein